MEWNSVLKKQTMSEKEKAMAKREQLDEMEDLLKQEQVAIGVLDQKAWKLLQDTEEAMLRPTLALQSVQSCRWMSPGGSWLWRGRNGSYRRRKRAPASLNTRRMTSRPVRTTSAPVRPSWRRSGNA
jgi:hypothetical protein